MIRIGLVDDQLLVRAGFAMVLSSQPDLEVVWQAEHGEQGCALAAEQPVDVILMDVQMPVMDGLQATRHIVGQAAKVQQAAGESDPVNRVIILTTFDIGDYVLKAIEYGASGFLLKDSDPEELLAAVRTVGDSTAVISPKATARLMRAMREQFLKSGNADEASAQSQACMPELSEPLTPREEEILVLIANGYSNQEIAEQLFISLPTVKTHVGRVLAKTNSRDRVQAVLFAFRHGLVAPEALLDPQR